MDCETSARKRQAERTRQKLLNAALERFAAEGFVGAKVKEICGDAGMADGILYHYFPAGKQEMLETIARQEFSEVSENMNAWLCKAEVLPLKQALEAILGGVADGFDKHVCFLKIILHSAELPDVPECKGFWSLMEDKRKWLPGLLKKRCEAGEIREMDFDSAAASVIAVVADHCFMRINGCSYTMLADAEKRRRYIDYLCSIWIKEKENA